MALWEEYSKISDCIDPLVVSLICQKFTTHLKGTICYKSPTYYKCVDKCLFLVVKYLEQKYRTRLMAPPGCVNKSNANVTLLTHCFHKIVPSNLQQL